MFSKFDVENFIKVKDYGSKSYERLVEETDNFIDEIPHEKVMVIADLADKLMQKAANITQLKALDDTQGDIKKLPYYKMLIDSIEAQSKLLGEKHKYVILLKKCFTILEDFKKDFMSGYKDKNNFVIIYYRSLFMGSLYVLYTLSVYNANTYKDIANNRKPENVITYVERQKHINEVFSNMEKLSNIETVGPLLNVDNKKKLFSLSFKASVESATLMEKMSEASLDTAMTYISLGLSKVLYYIFSPIRFIIYFFYRAGFGIQERLNIVEKTLEMYNANNSDTRLRIAGEVSDAAIHTHIKEMDAVRPAIQDMNSDKIEI